MKEFQMALPKLSEKELIERLTNVFQEYGFEGASLTRISQNTGLEKASLYHRFPGGKDQMAEAVVNFVAHCFVSELLAPLSGEGPLQDRIKLCATRLQAFYAKGTRSCVLDTMSLPAGSPDLRSAVESTHKIWTDSFAAVSKEAGHSPSQSRQRAEEAVIGIHGALVLARATGNTKPFGRMLARLPELLTS